MLALIKSLVYFRECPPLNGMYINSSYITDRKAQCNALSGVFIPCKS